MYITRLRDINLSSGHLLRHKILYRVLVGHTFYTTNICKSCKRIGGKQHTRVGTQLFLLTTYADSFSNLVFGDLVSLRYDLYYASTHTEIQIK